MFVPLYMTFLKRLSGETKRVGGVAVVGFMLFVVILGGCKKQDNQSQTYPVAKVHLNLNTLDLRKAKFAVNVIGSSMVTAVEGSTTTATNSGALVPLVPLSQVMQNLADGTVTMTLPVGTPVRLVETSFTKVLSLAQAQARGTSDSIGISEPFTLTGLETTKTLQIIRHDAPVVSTFTPAGNATGVAVLPSLTVGFSNPMDLASLNVISSGTSCAGTIQLSSNNFATCVALSGATKLSADGKTLTAVPAANLAYSTQYKLKITTGAADTLGNKMVAERIVSKNFATLD